MPYLFLAAFVFILFILWLQKLEHAETRPLIQTLKWTFVGVMVLAIFCLTLVGRLLHVAAIVVLLIILLKKDMNTWIKKKPPPAAIAPPMTKEEAAALLKVNIEASKEDIEAAFKRQKPRDSIKRDRLAQAREVLLKGQ